MCARLQDLSAISYLAMAEIAAARIIDSNLGRVSSSTD